MTVGELNHRISGQELMEWMAFDILEPLGHDKEDFRTALLCNTVAASAGGDVPFETFYKQLDFSEPLRQEIEDAYEAEHPEILEAKRAAHVEKMQMQLLGAFAR